MQYILLKYKIHSINSSYPITICTWSLLPSVLLYLLYRPFCSPWLLFRAPSFFIETLALFKWFSCHILDFSSSPEPTLYRTVPWITIFKYRASQLEFVELFRGFMRKLQANNKLNRKNKSAPIASWLVHRHTARPTSIPVSRSFTNPAPPLLPVLSCHLSVLS